VRLVPALRIRLPAQGHQIIPPGPARRPADRPNAERCRRIEINMLRCIFCGFCQEVCPEEAIFLQKDYSLTGTSREENDLQQGKPSHWRQRWRQK